MRAAAVLLAAILMVPAAACATDWGQIIDKSVRFYFAIDKAKQLGVPVKEFKLVQEGNSVYWVGRFGHAKWETSGEVIYGNMSALTGVYMGILSGEVKPKEWPEPEKSRFESGITTGLAKILSLQQEDGGWGWKVVLTEGITRFPAGKGHVLRTSQILWGVLIPALRLNIRTVEYGGVKYDVAEHARAAVRFLVDQQLPDGGYSANKEWSRTEDPLYTAWALRALCDAYRYRDLIGLDKATVQQVKQTIVKTVNWLLSHQEKSGDHAGLWKMESAAIMGSEYAPPSEAEIVLSLMYAYLIRNEIGLNGDALKQAINRALDGIVNWALKYKDVALIQFDDRKMLGWAYSSTRLEAYGPYLNYTSLITAVLTLAHDLGLGSEALQKMRSVGVTLDDEAAWVAHEWREKDGIGYFFYPNAENPLAVTPSSQLYGILCAVAVSHPEVMLKRTTSNVWNIVPKMNVVPKMTAAKSTGTSTSKRKGLPVWPVMILAVLPLARWRR